jgi:hypothetical protein
MQEQRAGRKPSASHAEQSTTGGDTLTTGGGANGSRVSSLSPARRAAPVVGGRPAGRPRHRFESRRDRYLPSSGGVSDVPAHPAAACGPPDRDADCAESGRQQRSRSWLITPRPRAANRCR